MNHDLSQIAVMNIVEGEEIFGGWATPHIPQVGIYKLLAKKKVDGTIEWAHFVQRDNGLKERVIRGTVNTSGELDIVTDTATVTCEGSSALLCWLPSTMSARWMGKKHQTQSTNRVAHRCQSEGARDVA